MSSRVNEMTTAAVVSLVDEQLPATQHGNRIRNAVSRAFNVHVYQLIPIPIVTVGATTYRAARAHGLPSSFTLTYNPDDRQLYVETLWEGRNTKIELSSLGHHELHWECKMVVGGKTITF